MIQAVRNPRLAPQKGRAANKRSALASSGKPASAKPASVKAASAKELPSAKDLPLTDQAYHQLEELITTLKLAPGTVLSEQALVKELGIGRTPIREALQRLGRDGLVVILPRRGILVSEINLRSQLRLLEARRVLENLIARLAAERASEDEIKLFADIARKMRLAAKAADDIAFMRLDRAFNELVAQASKNEFALSALGNMSSLSRRFWYQHYKEAADLPLCANIHADVCEAIAHRDPKAAGRNSDRLMDYIESFARRTLDI